MENFKKIEKEDLKKVNGAGEQGYGVRKVGAINESKFFAEKLGKNDMRILIHNLRNPFMYRLERECRLCGKHWTEYHDMSFRWMTDSICDECCTKRKSIDKGENEKYDQNG